ncbi:hypothetical protein SCOR_13030 [Sulfidibacter corallicola]|uniref:Uncharacterized protein n=1 Tax=Sulfidibacter corallicola TaxID=2818388 RepID=A0A8A4TCB9_SULCO|nr:hypothetical protein [Sulfidibacter corallicola]QTD47749.1 hypothetical protein J3U87_19345 [Sulfidibacter corallicola]
MWYLFLLLLCVQKEPDLPVEEPENQRANPQPATPREPFPMRARMLRDIQAALSTHQPSIWDLTHPDTDISLSWTPEQMQGQVQFKRLILSSPDQGYTVFEVWQLPPDQLTRFCELWGHPEQVTWDNLLANLPNGRLVAKREEGKLMIFRDYPQDEDVWHKPPFNLVLLPIWRATQVPGEIEGQAPIEPEVPFTEDSQPRASFLADLVNEELMDREGVPIRLSQTWDVTEKFSRLSPRIAVERRLKRDFNGTYTVFDIFSLEVEFLVGDRKIRAEERSTRETGARLETAKRLITIRHGYANWHEALFAKPFSPRRLPYTAENLASLPVGMRIILPSSTGLTLVEDVSRTNIFGQSLPVRHNAFMGIRGTFFISIVKRNESEMDLRFGARIERPFSLDLRIRPDFDGYFDPLRLVVGTALQLRTERTYGSRIFLQKKVDLKDPAAVRETLDTLSRGLRFNGLFLGTAAIINFTFLPRIDAFLVDRFIRGTLPEIAWETRLESRYLYRENYGKIGFRPISLRGQKTIIEDDWHLFDLLNLSENRGRSGSFTFDRTFRFIDTVHNRHVQTLAFEGIGSISDEYGEDNFYGQVVDQISQGRMSPIRYYQVTQRMKRTLGERAPLSRSGSWFPKTHLEDAEIGYRLVIGDEGMDQAADVVATALKERRGQRTKLGRWLLFRPILRYRLRRSMDQTSLRNFHLSKMMFKLAKKRGPLHQVLAGIDEENYLLEYRETAKNQPRIHDKSGDAEIVSRIIAARKRWEEFSVFDDIFVDKNFSAGGN